MTNKRSIRKVEVLAGSRSAQSRAVDESQLHVAVLGQLERHRVAYRVSLAQGEGRDHRSVEKNATAIVTPLITMAGAVVAHFGEPAPFTGQGGQLIDHKELQGVVFRDRNCTTLFVVLVLPCGHTESVVGVAHGLVQEICRRHKVGVLALVCQSVVLDGVGADVAHIAAGILCIPEGNAPVGGIRVGLCHARIAP